MRYRIAETNDRQLRIGGSGCPYPMRRFISGGLLWLVVGAA